MSPKKIVNVLAFVVIAIGSVSFSFAGPPTPGKPSSCYGGGYACVCDPGLTCVANQYGCGCF